MISLVFLDFNKDSLKDSSKQAISFSNLFNEKVYGITDVNDKDYLSTLEGFLALLRDEQGHLASF